MGGSHVTITHYKLSNALEGNNRFVESRVGLENDINRSRRLRLISFSRPTRDLTNCCFPPVRLTMILLFDYWVLMYWKNFVHRT